MLKRPLTRLLTGGSDPSSCSARRRRLLLLLALVSASLVLCFTTVGTVSRTYESLSGEALPAALSGQDCGPSPLAPVAWLGHQPLVISMERLEAGSRFEVKLRTDSGHAPVLALCDGHEQARLDVGPAWRTFTFWLAHDGDEIELAQPNHPGVRIHVARVKLTNVAGFVEGALNAWIVRRRVRLRPTPARSRLLVFLMLVGAAIGISRHLTQGVLASGSGVTRAAAAMMFGALLMLASQLVAILSSFRLVVAPQTMALILLVPAVLVGSWPLIQRISPAHVRAALVHPAVRTSVVVGLVAMAWAIGLFAVVQGREHGDLRGVARFGWKFPLPPAVEDVPESTRTGYDGQFYAVLASDPFLRNPATVRALDNPGYRATRGLVPFLAWATVGGSARLGPFAYVIWCWVLGLAGPMVVCFWLRGSRWRLVWFVLLSFNSGLVVSMLRATPDAAALTLMLAALLLAERRTRPAVTAAGGALAALARETSVLALPGLAWPDLKARSWRRALLLFLIPVGVVGSWRRYTLAVTHRGVGSALTNFGLPFAWLPRKLQQLRTIGWEYGKIEWIGVVWVLLLVGAAGSYLVRRRRLTPALITFLLFSLLAVVLNMRVYIEASASARVLIALPFLAAVLAVDERARWRRWLLVLAVILAFVQGALLLRLDVLGAWHAFETRVATPSASSHPTGLAISGLAERTAAGWRVPPGQPVTVSAVSRTALATLAVLSGELEVRRDGRSVLSLGHGESATVPVGHESGLELLGRGQEGALMAPLKPAPAANVPKETLLVPVVAGVGGYGGTNWTTKLTLTSRAKDPQRVRLVFLPRRGDERDRKWAEVTVRPGRELRFSETVPKLFGVHAAGALLVAAADPPPLVKCEVGHRTTAGVRWVDVPVLTPAQLAAATQRPWATAVPVNGERQQASLVLINPRSSPTVARWTVRTDRGSVRRWEVRLDRWDVRQFELPLPDETQKLQVSVSGPGERTPFSVLSMTNESTGGWELWWPGPRETPHVGG